MFCSDCVHKTQQHKIPLSDRNKTPASLSIARYLCECVPTGRGHPAAQPQVIVLFLLLNLPFFGRLFAGHSLSALVQLSHNCFLVGTMSMLPRQTGYSRDAKGKLFAFPIVSLRDSLLFVVCLYSE